MQERHLSASPVEVVLEVWDGSEEHARALGELIRASRGLWSDREDKEQRT